MKNIISLIKTLISLISIFILTKNKNKKIKNTIFYFPVKVYQENLLEVVNKLEKKNFNVFLAYNSLSSDEIKKQKKSLFLDFSIIRFIPFKNYFLKHINLFLSSYIAYVFPPKSKNIYISHDIYDAPMVNKNLEKKIFLRINKLDFIFTSSDLSSKYFISIFKKFKISRKPKLINTGYLKLDHVEKIINENKNLPKKSILIAPGYSLSFKKYNMTPNLDKIIDLLLKKTNEKIIYRPHPLDSTNKGNKILIEKIHSKFQHNLKFSIDLSVSYLDSYKNAKILITDLSSTAYTFAFSTLRPVIFFSRNETLLKKDKLSDTNFFHDRHKIGTIVKQYKNILDKFSSMSSKNNKYTRQIKLLRKKRIKYFGQASKTTIKEIKNIL